MEKNHFGNKIRLGVLQKHKKNPRLSTRVYKFWWS